MAFSGRAGGQQAFPASHSLARLQAFVESLQAGRNAVSSAAAEKLEVAVSLLTMPGTLSLEQVRSVCFYGLPDVTPLRKIYWMILLGVLSPHTERWPDELRSTRDKYEGYINDCIDPNIMQKAQVGGPRDANAASAHSIREGRASLSESRPASDHPLNRDRQGAWHRLFEGSELFGTIVKDVSRTRTDLAFFRSESWSLPDSQGSANGGSDAAADGHTAAGTSAAATSNGAASGPGPVSFVERLTRPSSHVDRMSRILFVYARLNPALGYIQGMNELLAVLYFVVHSDPLAHDEDPLLLEAEAFFLFVTLMVHQRDFFLALDGRSSATLDDTLEQYAGLLHQRDPQLAQHLDHMHIEPHLYMLRWLLLGFSQDMELPNVIRIWDTILADNPIAIPDIDTSLQTLPTAFYIAVAVLRVPELRSQLLSLHDREEVLRTIQHFPMHDIQQILSEATQIRSDDIVARRERHDRRQQYPRNLERRPTWEKAKRVGEKIIGTLFRG
ncbi:unnamed protein product [Vitrella brassicaformis CCMP3155]|uniref:Rab-GAP TBC domain-containing protein n=2 Tax=Vitrella brassicaformis TaxID=1169539 RepID=A0A0G4EU11_VITBC|nr:unnamed protein product [Vitrella brassicaformis CCMP3155]|eukprot:CEM01750.1 unnamed protein product [Vitrella brassicaformis CCMP3155]